MSFALCDVSALSLFDRLVNGPLTRPKEIPEIERFLRTVLLHDKIAVEEEPLPPHKLVGRIPRGNSLTESIPAVLVASRPSLLDYPFVQEETPKLDVSSTDLSPELIHALERYIDEYEPDERPVDMLQARTGKRLAFIESDGSFDRWNFLQQHLAFAKRITAASTAGASLMLGGRFSTLMVQNSRRYPADLFEQLDRDWRIFAESYEETVQLRTPPILSIVLSRCAKRDAIPYVVTDLRNEWSAARKKVWGLLAAQKAATTLVEAERIKTEIREASKLFSFVESEFDTEPIQVLWQILGSALAGAAVTKVAGGNALVGGVSAAIVQSGRSLPVAINDFGKAVFGTGAFDLAKKVRRNLARSELDALAKLISSHELAALSSGLHGE